MNTICLHFSFAYFLYFVCCLFVFTIFSIYNRNLFVTYQTGNCFVEAGVISKLSIWPIYEATNSGMEMQAFQKNGNMGRHIAILSWFNGLSWKK
jgi:hypothetical protein